MTGTGKTWSLKRIAKALLRHRQRVLVWSGVADREWPRGCSYIGDAHALEQALKKAENFGAHVILDEAPTLFQLTAEKTHPAIWQLARMGRHRGYTVHFATQYPVGIPRPIRANCDNLRCFALQNEDYAQSVVRDYGLPKLWREKIVGLPKLHYIEKRGGGDPVLKRL